MRQSELKIQKARGGDYAGKLDKSQREGGKGLTQRARKAGQRRAWTLRAEVHAFIGMVLILVSHTVSKRLTGKGVW